MTALCLIILRIKNVSDKSCRENQNTHFHSITFFRKSRRLWDNVEKYCRARPATNDNMANVHCMLGNQGYRHTLKICNTYSFALQQCLQEHGAMLHVHCPSCCVLLVTYAHFVCSQTILRSTFGSVPIQTSYFLPYSYSSCVLSFLT